MEIKALDVFAKKGVKDGYVVCLITTNRIKGEPRWYITYLKTIGYKKEEDTWTSGPYTLETVDETLRNLSVEYVGNLREGIEKVWS